MNGGKLSAAALAILGGTVVFACATATGKVEGGDALFDASVPVANADAKVSCDIDFDGGAASGDASVEGGVTASATWTALFGDYFGPTGRASCAGDGSCHGDSGQQGAKSSGNYVCGADKDACRNSLLSTDTGLIQIPRDQDKPENSGLVQELRRRASDGSVTGLMPKRPQCIFEPGAIGRIELWIKNGAPND